MSPYRMNKIEESIRVTLAFFDAINKRDISQIRTLLAVDCLYDDIWEGSEIRSTKDSVIRYIETNISNYPQIKMIVTDANNLVHRCIVKYKYFGLYSDAEKWVDCIGLFEVKNGLIGSVCMYCKK